MIIPDSITLPDGLSIGLASRGDTFLGLAEIRIGGQLVRSGHRPMFVDIRNPSGVQLSDYRLIACEIAGDKATLRFSMHRQEGGQMEWMVHEIRPRVNTADWSREPAPAQDTYLTLELQAVQRAFGRKTCVGFSYRYHYESASIPIYKILDRATWEPGGDILGAEFWMRNCFAPSIQEFKTAAEFYSTEWYIHGAANPNVFQFLPLQTELQGFTFTASPQGTLVTWVNEISHIRSLFEKPRNQSVLVHLHEHCGDLAPCFSTAPVEILWCPGELDFTGRANLYHAVREVVAASLHTQAGLRRERVSTYGQIEEWTPADLERYRQVGLPRLLEAGTKSIYLANHFENNMNTWGVSNFCCTVDYKVSTTVGEEKLREFCLAAERGGATVEMWANTSISTLTWMFDQRNGDSDRIRFLPRQDSIMAEIDPETAFVRNPSNAIEADHYTPLFAVLNLRDDRVRAYWIRRWREAHDTLGLRSIFLDSSFNLSSDKFHYVQNTTSRLAGVTADQVALHGNQRPAQEPPAAILSQYHAHLSLMAEMQKLGYTYCNEDLGVFGIHRHGPAVTQRLTSLPIWTDCIADFDAKAIRETGHDPEDIFFRSLAYRQMWSVYWDIKRDELTLNPRRDGDPENVPSPRQLALLHAYNQVEQVMIDRTILPGETGVLYRSGPAWVLWAFTENSVPEAAVDVLTGGQIAAGALVSRGIYASLV